MLKKVKSGDFPDLNIFWLSYLKDYLTGLCTWQLNNFFFSFDVYLPVLLSCTCNSVVLKWFFLH